MSSGAKKQGGAARDACGWQHATQDNGVRHAEVGYAYVYSCRVRRGWKCDGSCGMDMAERGKFIGVLVYLVGMISDCMA